jgi:hypothetical protein
MMVHCPAIDGIIDEAEDVAGEVEDKSVLDAALIAAAQAIEHYEITRYGTLIAWAKELGRNGLRGFALAEPRRGKSGRQEADRDGREQAQSPRRVIFRPARDGGSFSAWRYGLERVRADSLRGHLGSRIPRGAIIAPADAAPSFFLLFSCSAAASLRTFVPTGQCVPGIVNWRRPAEQTATR